MAILIDAYNLLNVTGVFAKSTGPGSVEQLRNAFLHFLVTSLDPQELPQTTVVFDRRSQRATSRRTERFGPITVHYAKRDENADDWIMELIQQHSAPRSLTVVSSDRQIQRAARRRRAHPVDSHVWHQELLRRRRERTHPKVPADAKPSVPVSTAEAEYWIAQFSEPGTEKLASSQQGMTKTETKLEDSLQQPFPASYLEDLERELRESQQGEPPTFPTKATDPEARKKPKKRR